MKKIFLVDDHPIVRRGLRQLIEREPQFTVCGEADNAADALLAIGELQPDLVVTDLALEGRSGLELIKQLRAHHPDLPILVVSMYDERLYAERVIAAGAQGYVMKRQTDELVVRAAREVLAGRLFASEEILEHLEVLALERDVPEATQPSGVSPLEMLTDRELEVFLLIGQGYAPRHIADTLSLSVSTIEVYRERLKDKLGLDTSALLTRFAVSWCRDHEPT